MERYEKYKDLGIEWIGEIPEKWSLKRLKYLLRENITDGPHETPEFVSDGIPFLSVDSIKDGEIIFENTRKISEVEHYRFQQKCKIERNDILMGKAASVGKIARAKVDFEFSIWSPLALIKAKTEIITSEFLEYYLKSEYSQAEIILLSSFNTQRNISMADIPKLNIVLPPTNEQYLISLYLDKKIAELNKIIENKGKLISFYEEEKQAIINQAVTKGLDPNVKLKDLGVEWLGEIPEHWILKKIGYCSSIVRGGSPRPSGDPRYFCGDYISWITVKEVTNAVGKYIELTEEFLTEEGSKLSRIIYPETLLLSNSGATLGVPKVSKIKGCINDGSVAFTSFKDCLLRDYLLLFFELHTQIYREEMKGNGQPNLNTEIIKSTPIAVPVEEQKMILRFIERSK